MPQEKRMADDLRDDLVSSSFWITPTYIAMTAFSFAVFFLTGGFGWVLGDPLGFVSYGLASANRVMNQLLTVVLTAIALVIPLSSNLYSPQLVRVYLSHPVIIFGLSSLVFGQGCLVTALLLGAGHPLYSLATAIAVVITYCALAGILPYLYLVSQFLRPNYFMPLLTKVSLRKISRLKSRHRNEEQDRAIFHSVDVIANIAFTGMRRGDQQLVLLCLRSLHRLLCEFLTKLSGNRETLQDIRPFFVAGIVREGREYLLQRQIWPEAYVLAHILEIMEQSDGKQHQMMAEVAHLLTQSLRIAENQDIDDLIELHILMFNTLMRMAIDRKDVRKFQNLSYHFRLMVEYLAWKPNWMEEVIRHLVHYGQMAHRLKLHGAYQTVLYDVGELSLHLAKMDVHLATSFLESHAAPIWFDGMEQGGHLEAVAWRSMLRVYWESIANDCPLISQLIEEHFLADKERHLKYLNQMLANNRPLHWEFNDRLLRMAYLSPQAESLAWDFLAG